MRDPIRTSRFLLRDLTEHDAGLLLELDSDPEVMRYIGLTPPPELEFYRQRVREVFVPWQAHPWHGIRLVLDAQDGAFLGWVFCRPADAHPFAEALGWRRSDGAEIGFRLRRAAWGRGVATESAQPLVERALSDPTTSAVVACALASNRASLRVLEKLGLERTGEALLPVAPEPAIQLVRVR